jgi:carboxymethylenebutenolidase
MTILHETTEIQTPSGVMHATIFRPDAEGNFPGLVMYTEIFQLTPSMHRTAAMLAGNGFVVVVPDIYHELEAPGAVIPYDGDGPQRGNAHKTEKPLAAYDADIRAALDFLKSHESCNGKLGATGFCIGGHIALRAAFHDDVLATTCFYPTDIDKRNLGTGAAADTLERLNEIGGEVLFIFARQDSHISPEGRAATYAAMTAANARFAWMEFNAEHAFLRDEGKRYNPALATICFGAALELFHRELR